MKTCRTCAVAKPADAYRIYRNVCRECENARTRKWYLAQEIKPHQRDDMKAYYRDWYAANAQSVKARAAEWNKAHPIERAAVCRENMRRNRNQLGDRYVRRMLAQEIGVRSAEIPQPLVEAQRELLKIKRYIREHSV